MQFRVAITDYNWFEYLSAQNPDEVNFWQPHGNRNFRAIAPGEPLLFKLHSPRNYIVGGGFFSRFSFLPIRFAWDAFKENNGATSLDEMRARVGKYRQTATVKEDELIGCILLQQPFFFTAEDWIPVSDWPPGIQQGKNYDSNDGARGQEIWTEVQHRLQKSQPEWDESVLIQTERYGKPQIVLPRLGQGSFRVVVADAYERACAVTSSHIFHILEAAHIKPYKRDGSHSPINGLLLRQDLHTLFDRGYVTVTPEYKLEISRRIKEEFNNGAEYYAMHGKGIHLPKLQQLRPSTEMLSWHNENVFKA